MNKNLLGAAVASIFLGLLFYVTGSFIAVSFDINQWSSAGRAFAGLFWMLGTVILFFMAIFHG